MSVLSEVGISLVDSDNPAKTSSFRESTGDEWSNYITQYSHTISASGGYDTMSFSLAAPTYIMDRWIQDGIGREITVYSPYGSIVWQGFVNEINAKIGGLTIDRGPFMNIANKVYVTYRTIRWNTNPPIGGQTRTTDAASDSTSQGKYGILETYVSGGEASDTQAGELRDTYLAEFKNPLTRQSLNLGSASNPAISIKCLGYYHMFKRYRYNNIVTPSLINASQKIENIVAAEPNSIFSTDYTGLDTNSMQLIDYEDQDRDGLGALKDIVAKGDTSGNRWIFMILDNRKAYYSQIPTSIEYSYSMTETSQRLRFLSGGIVQPWDIRPGKWVVVVDLLVGMAEPATLREDSRNMFIESVTYSAPYSLSMKGGKTDTFAQKLANAGLGGI